MVVIYIELLMITHLYTRYTRINDAFSKVHEYKVTPGVQYFPLEKKRRRTIQACAHKLGIYPKWDFSIS